LLFYTASLLKLTIFRLKTTKIHNSTGFTFAVFKIKIQMIMKNEMKTGMKKVLFLVLVYLFLLIGLRSLNAQVTIGSLEDPHGAAVLDLSKTSGRELGLLLPRVSLDDAKLWGLEPAPSIGAEGLMVYNVKDDVLHGNGVGVYVWNGNTDGWIPLKSNFSSVVKVVSFDLTPSDVSVDIWAGGIQDFEVSNFLPAGATYQGVTWQITAGSSHAEITSTTSTTCTVRGLTEGNATLKVTGIDEHFSKSVTVQVKPVTVDDCSSVMDAEQNTYLTTKFGAAGCWMTQNLRSTYTYHGTTKQAITRSSNSSNANSAYYYYPNAQSSLSDPVYGALYTWAAANIGVVATDTETNPTDRQGICPTGWHVPTDIEWGELEKEIASNPSAYSTQQIPYSGATSYNYTSSSEWRPSNTNADNTYWGRQMKSNTSVYGIAAIGSSKTAADGGFDALAVGYIYGGKVEEYGSSAVFWSSSAYSDISAWRRWLKHSSHGVSRTQSGKHNLFSVRCKKD
jgi:uncharacterized protein (TIGR02145 family)